MLFIIFYIFLFTQLHAQDAHYNEQIQELITCFAISYQLEVNKKLRSDITPYIQDTCLSLESWKSLIQNGENSHNESFKNTLLTYYVHYQQSILCKNAVHQLFTNFRLKKAESALKKSMEQLPIKTSTLEFDTTVEIIRKMTQHIMQKK